MKDNIDEVSENLNQLTILKNENHKLYYIPNGMEIDYEIKKQIKFDKNQNQKEDLIFKINKEKDIKISNQDDKIEFSKIKNQESQNFNKEKEETKDSETQLCQIKYNKKDFLDFYHLIIDLKSLTYKHLKNGINILKRKEIDITKCFEDIITIGITGESNVGKSYILSRICEIDIPCGNSIITKGLSIVFPNLNNNSLKNIIVLDSAGNESLLLENDESINEKVDSSDFEAYKKKIEYYVTDKQSTEFFLQKYILETSNIVIAVIGQLTRQNEKFINKIKLFCDRKLLFIIHNLKNLTTIKDCENHIQDKKKNLFFLI